MPFNGAGVFVPIPAPDYPAVASTTIRSAQFNANLSDIFGGLTACITRDGQSAAQNNLPMAGFRHTNVGDAQNGNEYMTLKQGINGTPHLVTSVGGTTTAYTGTVIGITAYSVGQYFWFTPNATNTGACTLNINSLGAKDLVPHTNTALLANQLIIGVTYLLYYDGTRFRIIAGFGTSIFRQSETAFASINIPHGAAPSAPNNGDIWTTTAGLFARINGTTEQFARLAAPNFVDYILVGRSGVGTGGNTRYISDDGNSRWLSGILGTGGATSYSIYDLIAAAERFSINSAGNAAFSGSVTIGGAAALVSGGALGTPASGTLTNCTGLPIATGVSGLGTGVATFLATPSSANLAAAITGETGTGALVFATSPTLVTPVLGTPTSGTLTNCTGLPIGAGTTGTLAADRGGTGIASYTTGNYIRASSATTLEQRTPAQVASDIGALASGGPLGTPSSGTLTNCTGLPIVAGTTGTLSVARGGTGTTTSTGSGNVVLSANATLTGTTSVATLAASTAITLGGVSLATTSIIKGASTSRTSTTTAAADPDLQVSSLPAGTYEVIVNAAVTAVSAAGQGLRCGLIGTNMTADGTGAVAVIGIAGTVSKFKLGSTGTGALWNEVSGSNTDASVKLTAIVALSATGSIEFHWAQSVSNANATRVESGSKMTVRRIA